MIACLAGGVGGAKLVYGLARVLGQEELTVIVNTADDLVMHGLYICPDLDTITYTLAGVADPKTGWGIEGDTFHLLGRLQEIGRPSWFRLGDRDMATHLVRTELLSRGRRLTEATAYLAKVQGVRATVLPMTDQPVATYVTTEEGEFAFQDYFVRLSARGEVKAVRFAGIEEARPTAEVMAAVKEASAIILCPSNPVVSILPILSLKDLRPAIREAKAVKLSVSPIIAGKALRGPAAQMMKGLNYEASAFGVASFYRDLLDLFVCDERDKAQKERIEALGIKVILANTIMETAADKEALARTLLSYL